MSVFGLSEKVGFVKMIFSILANGVFFGYWMDLMDVLFSIRLDSESGLQINVKPFP